MSARAELPRGTVTFLFTDIEGSTRLLNTLGGERYHEVLSDHQRLLRATRRTLNELDRLPQRRRHPLVRRRLQTEFANRLGRIRRRLGLPVGRPRAQTSYRTTDAARLIGVSRKTLLRWVAARRVHCERADTYKRPRYFHRRDLARVIASLKI